MMFESNSASDITAAVQFNVIETAKGDCKVHLFDESKTLASSKLYSLVNKNTFFDAQNAGNCIYKLFNLNIFCTCGCATFKYSLEITSTIISIVIIKSITPKIKLGYTSFLCAPS